MYRRGLATEIGGVSGPPVYNPNINSYPNPNTYPNPNVVWPGIVSSSLFKTRFIIFSNQIEMQDGGDNIQGK